ncbi:hypothetical protein G7046_g1738 [Stylonectria norvegica]|nr:hypothetical protein G7046_g1738 [Stylonectria norvegica]
MRSSPLLVLGLLLGAEATRKHVRRQDISSNVETNNDDSSTVIQVVTTTSAAPTVATTTSAANSPTSTPDATTSSASATQPSDTSDNTPSDTATTSAAGGDTTVTRTTTVTDGNGGTVSQKTTVLTTITSTIVVTSTAFETTTVTSSDAQTATKTVYETSTHWANQKRALDFAPRTVGPGELEAEASASAAPAITRMGELELELLRRRNHLQKRDTITAMVTVTVGKDSKATVVDTITRTVISTASKETKITNTVTETEQVDAKTTTTVTSTLIVTSTAVTTGVVQTMTVAPSGSYGAAGTGGATSGDSSSSSSSGGSKGLSTGAKAGIGAGCGVVGLAVLGGLLWFCLKRRRSGPKPDPDEMFGSSEVPVGGRAGGRTPPMSQHTPAAAAMLTPGRTPTKSTVNEGYRGTARGDGRAGLAKPEAFGAAYANPATSPETAYSRTTADTYPDAAEMDSPANTAELGNDGGRTRFNDTDAAEIDGNQVSSLRGSAPPDNVYEMPTQPYR